MVKRFRWLIPLLLVLLSPAVAHAQFFPDQGWCEDGNKNVVTSGLDSTNVVQASYSACTVAVAIHGGGTATIYSDEGGTPLANPFTASANGQWIFYSTPGRYDVTISGGTPAMPAPVTFSATLILAGSGVTSFSTGNLAPLFTASVTNPTTTPALSFALSSAAANTVFGRFAGTTGAPSYGTLTSSMVIPPGATTQVIYNLASAFAASADFTFNDSTDTTTFATSGTPMIRILPDSGAPKLLFGASSTPYFRDNGGTGWFFGQGAGQDLYIGPPGDPFSAVFGGDGSAGIGHGSLRLGIGSAEGVLYLNDGLSGAGVFQGPFVLAGNTSPEGAITARVGSVFLRGDGAVGSTLYIKQTGTGNTGWSAFTCGSGVNCSAPLFFSGDGAVGAPAYSFTNATTSGWFWSGTQAVLSRAGVSQMATNGGPGITSSGTVCMTTTTRCLSAGTASTSLEPYVSVTGGAIMLGVPLVAGNPTTTGWGNAERGGLYFNTTSGVARYWNGSVLRDFGPQVFDCGTTTTCANTATTAARTIIGSVALSTGTPSTATVASISPAFTSTATYRCTAVEATDATKNLIKIVNTSSSSFTITGPDTNTDTFHYICAGY